MSKDPVKKPISFFYTHVSEESIKRVNEVLRSGWLNEGEIVREFETKLEHELNVSNPITVNSGTSALHLALVLSGVGQKDEVILPAQTFIATGLAILMQNAKPVFADINPRTGNIDVADIKTRITPRTKVILPVHWGGYPCDMDEIGDLAAKHNLTIIEDAAHALGATYKNKPIGTISRFTAFSFQAIKPLTTGDGGMLCCKNVDDARNAKIRRWFGIDRANVKRTLYGDRGYNVSVLGYKYHMNNVTAAIGLGNIADFNTHLVRRQKIGEFYRKELNNVPGLKLLELKKDRTHSYWTFHLLVENRDEFIHKMNEHSIPVSVVDLSIDRYSVFGSAQRDLPGQSEFNRSQIAIPIHAGLMDSDIERIVDCIKTGW